MCDGSFELPHNLSINSNSHLYDWDSRAYARVISVLSVPGKSRLQVHVLHVCTCYAMAEAACA